jgi:hypothetical protein
MKTISKETKQLIEAYQNWQTMSQKKENTVAIHIDEIACRVAAFYEKIRGIVDWKEEHLLRRSAIIRMLKRRMLSYKDGGNFTEGLVSELIRGGHFPNNEIPEEKIEEVQKIIEKYVFILANSPQNKENLKHRLYDWIIGLAACEIEENLSPPRKEKALIKYMEKMMREKIEIKGKVFADIEISDEEKNTQIFIAVQRALFKLDAPIISYNLLKKEFPEWKNPSPDLLDEISKNIYSIWKESEKELYHPLSDKFYKICERYDTPHLILNPKKKSLTEKFWKAK